MTSLGSHEDSGTRATSPQRAWLVTFLKACVGQLVLAVFGHFPRNLRGSGRGQRGPPRPAVAHSSDFMILISVSRGAWATGSRAHGRQAAPKSLKFVGASSTPQHRTGSLCGVWGECATSRTLFLYSIKKLHDVAGPGGPATSCGRGPSWDTPLHQEASESRASPSPNRSMRAG